MASKFVLKWEGPYVIIEAYDCGYLLIFEPESEDTYLQLILNGWIVLSLK